jgi:hypothetical protein
MKKSDVFRKLVKLHNDINQYLDRVPSDIVQSIFDNEYSNNQGHMVDLLIDEYFGEHAESVLWFMYEWKPGFAVGYDGNAQKIYSLDEYIEYLKVHEGFE